jgi:hypothetical protein
MTESVNEQYFSRFAGLQVLGGAMGLGAGLVSMSLSAGGTFPITMGLLILALGLVTKYTPLVGIRADVMEVRAAPMAVKKFVRFSDIRVVRPKGKNLVLETSRGEVTVPLGLLASNEAELVRERIVKSARPALAA